MFFSWRISIHLASTVEFFFFLISFKVFDDPHIKSIDAVQEMEHPQMGNVKLVSPAVKYSYGTNKIRSPPPTLGEHTIEVLKNVLNYSDDKINTLTENKIIQ